MNFVRPILLDTADTLILDVARDNAGKGAAQVGGQFVWREVAAQLQARHIFMGGIEGTLKAFFDAQQPVEVKSVMTLAAELFDFLQPAGHLPCNFRRIINDDLVMLLCGFTQSGANECV